MNTLKVSITGSAGQIAYSLIPHILSGDTFGEKVKIDLRLQDLERMLPVVEGVKMEIEDSLFPSVGKVTVTSSQQVAFDDADFAILLGGFPRKQGMIRKDLLVKNKPIFASAGKALSKFAKKDVKVLVVANPANTNALELLRNSELSPKNVTALTRLDANRTAALISRTIGCKTSEIENFSIWGNHSDTQVPDISKATVRGRKIMEDKDYAKQINQKSIVETVAKRGLDVISARSLSSSLSAAVAIRDHLKDWYFGTRGKVTAMAVFSQGNPFGIDNNLFFSFPVLIENGEWKFAKSFTMPSENSWLNIKIKASEKELLDEMNALQK